MFYSETLLSKTGPLAKVWLAANVERKLSKGDVLKQSIEKDVRNIVSDQQAPLALRLTSQLLLGVVRIYSRKARYLLDDCNEALMKIKLAFRPGNVDLPSAHSHIANPAALTLPDTITELDLFAPMPAPEELLFGPAGGFGGDQTTLDWGTSQLLTESSVDERRERRTLELDDLDLGIDIGEDIRTPGPEDRSIEVGRRAEVARPDRPGESTLFEDDLGIDLGLDDPTVMQTTDNDVLPLPEDDYPMGSVDDLSLGIEKSNQNALARAEERRGERETLSPLSELAPEEEQELERTFQLEQPEEEDETQVQAQQRVKRRKVLQNDINTELPNSQIRAQLEDRSKIVKQPTFLPRDPMLLALMNMQKSGGFVSSILGDGRSLGWAPELRGVLSLEVVRRAGDLKRKRDSGVPQIELPAEEDDLPREPSAMLDDPTLGGEEGGPVMLPSDGVTPFPDEPLAMQDDEEAYAPGTPGPAFDETTIPVVHPADSGPVSLATKHAVHMLREHFGGAEGEAPSPSTRAQQSVLFTNLCPEDRTTREDATKLFFETLVLGTKDAIKVEQGPDELGGEIRIRGKRGLWGNWAEMGVSQSQGGALGTQTAAVEEDIEV